MNQRNGKVNVTESVPAGIFILDKNEIAEVLAPFAKLLDHPKEEYLRDQHGHLQLWIDPADVQRAKQLLNKLNCTKE